MYFLSHMYVIMQGLTKEELVNEKETITALLVGSWGPDLGYFPFYSKKLTVFGHEEKPKVNLYLNDTKKAEAFERGWKIHLHCDKIIHEEPYFDDGGAMCPLIIRGKGLKTFWQSAKEHLGREIGLDVFIYKELLEKNGIMKDLFEKEFYKREKIAYPGIKKVKKYIYTYLTKIVPKIAKGKGMGKVLKRIINYSFFEEEQNKEQAKKMLERMIREIVEIS